MKVKELVDFLKEIDQNLNVYVYADHGQETICANSFGVRYCENGDENSYFIDESFTKDDLLEEGDDPSDFSAFVEIGGQ